MADYLTITPACGSATIYSFVYPVESGTTFLGSIAIDRCTPFVRGGIPELRFQRVIGTLAPFPDTFESVFTSTPTTNATVVSWSNGSSHSAATTYFVGTLVGCTDRFDSTAGWIRNYRCLGLRNLADYVPVTDSNTGSDVARWNIPANSIATIPSREGRTVGQAVLELLSMPQNVAALSAYGIGAYTSSGSGATATANMVMTYSGGYGTISSLSLTAGGSGYGTTPPTVVIVGPCTTQASYTANLTAGAVSSFTQVSAGSGYNSTPSVIISTLPASTIGDLNNLTVIPPFAISFAGERILSSIESVVQTCHPNHWTYMLGDTVGGDIPGTIRILDQRATTDYQVVLGNPSGSPEADGVTYGDRWSMPTLSRDSSDTYSRLEVRGGPLVTGVYLSVIPQVDTTMNATITDSTLGVSGVNTGGLFPYFGFGAYPSNTGAVGQWSPNSFVQQSLQGGQDQGTITTIGSTTSVTIKSSNTALTLSSDQLDQSSTGLRAILTVIQSPLTGLQQMFSTSVIANTAMTAGSTSTLTVSPPLPVTTYTSYFLTFSSQAGNVVWRQYVVVDSSGYGTSSKLGPALQQYFPYPFAYKNASGTAAALTSAPVGAVLWSNGTTVSSTTYLNNGAAPWNESDFSVTVNPSNGTISFPSPVNLVYGGGSTSTPPSNVQVFVPVATGVLSVLNQVPGSGTVHVINGSTSITFSASQSGLTGFYLQVTGDSTGGSYLIASGSGTGWTLGTAYQGSTNTAAIWLTTGGFSGTLRTVDGVQRTKVITLRDWTQESGVNQNIQVYANEQFDSIKDVVVEGSISYLGLATPYLVPGYSISIHGQGYTTGWETLQSSGWPPGLPVSQAEVVFQWNASGTSYLTNLSLTNRRQSYTAEVFLRPTPRDQMLGGQPFGAGYGTEWNKGLSNLGSFAPGILDSMLPGDGPPGDLSSLGMGGAGHRGVTIDDTNHQIQRQRRDERREQQQQNAGRAREGMTQEGPPAPTEYPFAEMNPPTPDTADIAQAERRKRAAMHTSEGSYNEARYGSEESQGMIADETHP